MLHRKTCCCLVAGIALFTTSAAYSGDTDPDTRIEHLVIGDGYFIQVEREGAQQVIPGDFEKTNDRWIVLHLTSEGRSERGVPVASNVPYMNRLFKNVGIRRTDELVWITRDAAKIRGRIRATNAVPPHSPIDDDPTPETACQITFVGADHKIATLAGKIEKFADDQLTLSIEETVSVEVRTPGWSKLPLVGGYFVSTQTKTNKTHRQIAQRDIICVRITKADLEKPSSAATTKAAAPAPSLCIAAH